MKDFIDKFNKLAGKIHRIKGTALYLSNSADSVPSYIKTTMFTNGIIYEENIVVKVETMKTAFGLTTHYKQQISPGFSILIIKVGYMEVGNIEKGVTFA